MTPPESSESVWIMPSQRQITRLIVGVVVFSTAYFVLTIPVIPIVSHAASQSVTCKPAPPPVVKPISKLFAYKHDIIPGKESETTWPVLYDPECPSSDIFDIYRFVHPNASSVIVRAMHRALWSVIPIRAPCPFELVKRLGKTEKGGRFTCGFRSVFHMICLMYSFDVSGSIHFEEAFANERSYCNMSIYAPEFPEQLRSRFVWAFRYQGLEFKKGTLGSVDAGSTKTLKTFMQLNNHRQEIDILKLDLGIDGDEVAVLENILNDFPDKIPFAQLLVRMYVKEWTLAVLERIVKLFKRLDSRGALVVSQQLCMDEAGHCCDFGLVNVNAKYWARANKPRSTPGPQDNYNGED